MPKKQRLNVLLKLICQELQFFSSVNIVLIGAFSVSIVFFTFEQETTIEDFLFR